MPGPDGYEVTKILKSNAELRYIPIVLLTGKDALKDIIYGLDQGADDYVCKPYDAQELIARVHAAVRTSKLYTELHDTKQANNQLQARLQENFSFGNIIGKSKAMAELYQVMAKVVDSDVSVLITGESGTGKEMVQNCAAFNENLLESELFGHVKGAFTGAMRDKQGLFEVADGGTFFLDELGEMSPALQVKLLRVLQDGTFMPVGGTKMKQVNVRIIAATNRNLDEMVKKGTFREDLYYRLNVVNLILPALRERSGDIPLLVESFLTKLAHKSNRARKAIAKDAVFALESYAWPGNIRQLENELQRAHVMSGNDDIITRSCLSPSILNVSEAGEGPAVERDGRLKEALEALEREMIIAALERSKGNKSEAARQLGVSRSNLIAKAQSFGMDNE